MSQSIWGSIPMLVARGRIENRQAIVRIGFQPFALEAMDLRPASATLEIPVHEYRALIDTGAQRTCLSKSVIAQENLKAHGKLPIQNVHGIKRHYLYLVQIGFFCERVVSLNDTLGQSTYYGTPNPTEIIDIADNHRFDAIIGMDFLSLFGFQIERDGSFSIRLD
ncbi:pepsin/retropepsin-like aspartic protease family protein [Sphingobium cloacae]|uniref:SEC-C motif domain protein n=1 Tax=Sphingobium cloacae TaxID=120107 RepID=A0A1E1F3X3_9SPHN|nr:hypothetical protein [Sphingobium cloacae]BAV65209.1 SEC-C motif domain protein [Sphingobium cloacae]